MWLKERGRFFEKGGLQVGREYGIICGVGYERFEVSVIEKTLQEAMSARLEGLCVRGTLLSSTPPPIV